MEPRDTAQISRTVDVVLDVLGDAVVGAYLHGSTAHDRLRPHSDIDVFAVTRRPSTVPERDALVDRLLQISGRGDPSGRARSIELTIVVESHVRPWRYPPRMDFQYGDWWRTEFENGDREPWASPNPDLAMVIAMVRAANRPVIGPEPATLLEPVPRADLDRAIVAGIPGLLTDLDGDTTNVVLTFARVWTTLATGQIRSKDGAADWAMPLLPDVHRPVLARARAIYLGERADEWDGLRERVRPHVDAVLAVISDLGSADTPR